MHYSASKNTWFASELRADYERSNSWPEDAVEYPREKFDKVVTCRPEGKIMVPDENGVPVLVDPPQPTEEELAVEIRAKRDRLLATYVDPVVSNPLRWNDLSADQQQAVIAYRKALLDVPEQPGFPLAVEWPEPPK